MPFITEEIYQKYFKRFEKTKSIHLTEFSKIDINEKIKAGDRFIEVLSQIRQEKTKAKKAMNAEIVLTLSKKDKTKMKSVLEDLKNVTNALEVKEGKFKVEFV